MPTTPTYALRYPAPTDPADVPTDMNELATDVETALNGKQATSAKGAANGYASLDSGGKVPLAQIPAGANGQWLKTASGAAVWSAITPTDIGLPKITVSQTVPASPADGDIWVLPLGTTGERWMFQYNAGSASSYKWEFVGGPPISTQGAAAGNGSTINTWINVGPSTLQLPRVGDYRLRGGTSVTGTSTGACTMLTALYLTSAANTLGFLQSVVIPGASYSLSVAIPEFRVNDLAANSQIGISGQSNAANCNWNGPTVSVYPIRIG